MYYTFQTTSQNTSQNTERQRHLETLSSINVSVTLVHNTLNITLTREMCNDGVCQ